MLVEDFAFSFSIATQATQNQHRFIDTLLCHQTSIFSRRRLSQGGLAPLFQLAPLLFQAFGIIFDYPQMAIGPFDIVTQSFGVHFARHHLALLAGH